MNTYLDCVPCVLRQSLDAARNVTGDTRIHEQIVRDVLRMMAELDLNRPPPFVGQAVHRRLRELTGVKDPYQAAKRRFNNLAKVKCPVVGCQVGLPVGTLALLAPTGHPDRLLPDCCFCLGRETALSNRSGLYQPL